ncbi:hypothetical protein [Vitiosangium sp. GDMCC 1.1324]|uniref:hypothetical protein n=1 Tax=Vitiosangium sp. (strain GDMCC 1.1324) TaxID=2138576 RepID=UPI000D3B528C|nr:hypothetical protein [Vitiosangium sp. GDMCC 1.1324]PTL76083.1 hypothetical protein DAT35_50825 [Vitiosangium sp. GDMCC 1.1324]
MSRRLSALLLSSCLTLPGLVLAGDLTPEQIARIRREEKAAAEKVNAAHGNKKSSELSAAERRQMIREQQEAIQEVMDKNGVSRKDYARQTARMGPEQNAQVEAADKALEAKEKAAQAAKSQEQGAGEIQVQNGFNDENPVTVEGQENGLPVVEHGIPAGEEGLPESE